MNNGCKFLIYYSQHCKRNGQKKHSANNNNSSKTTTRNEKQIEKTREKKIEYAAFWLKMHITE